MDDIIYNNNYCKNSECVSAHISKGNHLLYNKEYIERLITVLSKSSHKKVIINILNILLQYIQSHRGAKVQLTKEVDVVNVVIKLITKEFKHQFCSNEILLTGYNLISKLASKDKKFGFKIRIYGLLTPTIKLLNENILSLNFLKPLFIVIKYSALDNLNAQLLKKNGTIDKIFSLISNGYRTQAHFLKIIINTLSHLLDINALVEDAISCNGVKILLDLYIDIHKKDIHNKKLLIRKGILLALNKLVNISSGSLELDKLNGVNVLYHETIGIKLTKDTKSLVDLSCNIMRKSFIKNRLPVASLNNPIEFALPELLANNQEFTVVTGKDFDCFSSEDEQDDSNRGVKFDSYLESSLFQNAVKRSASDLEIYSEFFTEMSYFKEYVSPKNESNSLPEITTIKFDLNSSLKVNKNRSFDLLPKLDIISLNEMSISGKSPRKLLLSNFSRQSSNNFQKFAGNKPTNKRNIKMKLAKGKNVRKSDPKDDNGSQISTLNLINGGESLMDEIMLKFKEEELCFKSNEYLVEDQSIYIELAGYSRAAGRFNKIAYSDLQGQYILDSVEPLYEKNNDIQRQKIFEDIDRFLHPELLIDHVVYDMDVYVSLAGRTFKDYYSTLNNEDEARLMEQIDASLPLKFNSQFECGNLRKAIQIRKHEYDLILMPDINCSKHHQWFYFEISNMELGVPYRFNIINCEKANSQFNFGMQPLMYSVFEAMQGNESWKRVGTDICYYRNHFLRDNQLNNNSKAKTYYTTTFTITFAHSPDVCYFAYHYPYSYTMLQYDLHKWELMYDSSTIYFNNQVLCKTLCGNEVPVLTITSSFPPHLNSQFTQISQRPYIFLSSRVHPGESNSSWVMRGTIDFLLSNSLIAQQLRDTFIFKIVPMLNPDGVINGCHRCSFSGVDLNRCWDNPCPVRHPTIYHTKGLLQYLQENEIKPVVFCDYHGHSRKKNIFLYGCDSTQSWIQINSSSSNTTSHKLIPQSLNDICPYFSYSLCEYSIEKSKEATARVVAYRQLDIDSSYTMESTYCGFDQGIYKGHQVNTKHLQEMGAYFAASLLTSRQNRSTLFEDNSKIINFSKSSDVLGSIYQDSCSLK